MLLEALRTGEISFDEYLILKEIYFQGLDSTNAHLLDQIPNLIYFLTDSSTLTTALEQEQEQSFVSESEVTSQKRVRWRYKYYQPLATESSTRYQTSVQAYLTEHFQTDFQVEREYSGREHITRRSLLYKNKHNLLSELRIGNYTKRLGLGTIAGYRGRVLEYSDRLDNESLLFPDYGGFNGLYMLLKPHSAWTTHFIASVNRDTEHRLTTAASMISWKQETIEIGSTFGINQLEDRETNKDVDDTKLGLYTRKHYKYGYAAVEITTQLDRRTLFDAAVLEGRHRFRHAEIRYAGWVYSDYFLDLASGSKAGNLTHGDSLMEVDFQFTTRRTGVEGGLLKTIIDLTDRTDLLSSLIYSSLDRHRADIQFLSGIIFRLNPRWSVRLDHLNKTKKQESVGAIDEKAERRTRCEVKYSDKNLLIRGYVSYHTQTGEPDNMSLFLRVQTEMKKLGQIEVWSNLARWDPVSRSIDYWYFYVKNRQQLLPDLFTGIKLSHRYSRQTSERHLTTIALEVTAQVW